ncbi:hypothetical protein [Francisella philomiragia]|uniref:Putative membrane protein n=1 Tax=Francisella philomiragia TaxID=28110 RepID=A0A0B6D4Y7_9GAMM|nr:hypothetical protein [Francisella philomiragia]AJI52728.1 putative membrane protein [Francisella philomiragia]
MISSKIKYLLATSILLNIIANWWGIINMSHNLGIIESILANSIIYQIAIVLCLFICFRKNIKLFFISFFIFSSYFLLTSPSLGVDSIKMLYYLFFWKYFNIQAYLFYLSSWLMPIISLIGVIFQIQEYKKSKNVIK